MSAAVWSAGLDKRDKDFFSVWNLMIGKMISFWFSDVRLSLVWVSIYVEAEKFEVVIESQLYIWLSLFY